MHSALYCFSEIKLFYCAELANVSKISKLNFEEHLIYVARVDHRGGVYK